MEIQRRWEHFSHEADVGVRGIGPDPASAFEEAALALTAAVTDPCLVEARERVAVACAAPDLELLLADWLNAVVGEMSARKMLFSRFRVSIDERCLTAQRGAGIPPGGRTADQGRIDERAAGERGAGSPPGGRTADQGRIDERAAGERGAGSPPGGRTADQGRIEGLELHGEAWGERADPPRHQPAAEPKGATYTALSVRRSEDGTWTAECVVDV